PPRALHSFPTRRSSDLDRMSMAHSLEVRVPLLDHHLLEWVLRLPWAMRFQRGRGKHLLRRVAARYLPASIVKPRKQGFTVPVGRSEEHTSELQSRFDLV